MKVPTRAALAARVLAAGGAVVVIAGCGGGSTSTHTTSAAKPVRTVALPKGLLSATPVEPNGYVWVLSDDGQAATLTQLELSNGGKAATVPVSTAATSVAQSPTGTIAVGLGTATTGALEFLNPAGQDPKTIPIGAPVKDVAYGASGQKVYVLNGTVDTSSVAVVGASSKRVTETVGLPLHTVSIVPTPNELSLWSLSANGTVSETSLVTHRIETSIAVGNTGIALASGGSGNTLYVLKRSSTSTNIGVINTATSAMTKVLPAAANSVDLGISVNSNELYDYVGSPAYGNVQVFDL